MEETIYTFKNARAQTQDASLREYADAHRKSATAPQAEQMVPEEWREQFAQAKKED